MTDQSKVIHSDNFAWESVPRRDYKDDTSIYKDVHRYTLLGGDADDEQELNFQCRYFEVQPGGYTTFEYHQHPHSVIVIRGEGEVILDDDVHDIGLHDVVYVAPGSTHQFQASKESPLGFLCIVDRERDRPNVPDDEFVEENILSENVMEKIRR